MNRFLKLFIPPKFDDPEATRQAAVLFAILWLLIFGALITAIPAFFPWLAGSGAIIVLNSLTILACAAGLRFARRGNIRLLAWVVSIGFFGLITYTVAILGGVSSVLYTAYLINTMITLMLLGRRAGYTFAALSMAVGFLLLRLDARLPLPAIQPEALLTNWLTSSVIIIISTVILSLATENLRLSLQDTTLANRDLEAMRADLESRITARTSNLALASEIGRRISAERGLEEMLAQTVELVRERFGLYYVQVYLADTRGRTLLFWAGTGPAGVELIRRGHALPIGPGSINAAAAASLAPIIVADVTRSPGYRPNPLLPATLSEAAIPLIARERLVGVLNLQSSLRGGLAPESLPAFNTLGGLLASAIENATLFAQAAQARQAAEEAARRLERTGWQDFLNAIERGERTGYAFAPSQLEPRKLLPENDRAPLPDAALISLLGEQLGSIEMEWEPGYTPEGVHGLLAAVAQQVAGQLENLRLLAQADRYRADAEEAVRRLTRASWEAYLDTLDARTPGFIYDQGEIKPAPAPTPGAAAPDTLHLPITVRGERIGELAIHAAGISDASFELATVVSGRLSAHIENIRLFQETERRGLEIEARRRDLEASQRVTFAAAESQSAEELLNLVVNLIRDQFKLYHVQVYLVDEAEQAAILRESTGDAGSQLLQHGQRLPLEADSLITRAIRAGEPVLVTDVRQEKAFLPDPHLPDTRSELVLPLRGSQRVLGVLDIHSTDMSYFMPDTVNLFRTMAEQVALIIERSQTAEALAQTLAVTEVLYAGSDRIVRAQTSAQVLKALVGSTGLQNLQRVGILLFDQPWRATPPASMTLEAFWDNTRLPGPNLIGARLPLGDAPLAGYLTPEDPLTLRNLDDDPVLAASIRRIFTAPDICGIAFFPMVVAGDWIGLIMGQSTEPLALTPEEIPQIDSLADQVAAVLQNQRLLAQNRQALAETAEQAQRLAALNEFSGQLGGVTSLAEALNVAASQIGAIIQVDLGSIAWLDETASQFEIFALRGAAGAVPVGERLPVEGTTLGQAVLERQPVLTPDLGGSPQIDALQLAQSGMRSSLVVPLLVGGRALGTLNVASLRPDAFSTNEISLMTQAAFLLAAAIENRRLFDQTERRATELETVSQVSTAASTILDTQELLQSFVDLSLARFNLSHAQIFLMEETGISLALTAASGRAGRRMLNEGRRISIHEEGVIAQAAFTREGLILNDVRPGTRALPSALLPGTRAEMALPLLAGDEMLGVLDLQSDQPNRFTDEDLRIHTTLASQVAVALQNARLFEELRQTAERLQEVDRLKSEFLANMSHELRTPLNSVIGYAEIILMGIEGEVSSEVKEDVEAIFNNGQHLLHLINDVLDLAKIESGRMTLNLEPLELRGLMEEVRTNNIGMILKARKPLQIVIEASEDLPAIQADRIRVSQILNNLVSNAIKFSEQGEIVIRGFRDDGEICLEVEDHGMGIAESAMFKIFEKFTQVDGSSTRQAEGTGLGLAISRHLAEMHGGFLSLRSQLGAGSTFSVRLPISGRKPAAAPEEA